MRDSKFQEKYLDLITRGFIACVEFAESENGESLSNESLQFAKDICENFYKNNCGIITAYATKLQTECPYSSIGHDFWLTMQGHGAGFWDRGFDKDMENQLTEISEAYHCECYIENNELVLDSWKLGTEI